MRDSRVEEIDFLKVDVEGAERDVLAGADWRRFRPKVVLVEAVAPGTMAPSHAEWEPILLSNGYGFAFFDGLNRFYVADEAAALKARFPQTPAPWDAVRHLYEFGRAPENPQHPDHALAKALAGACLAALPTLDPEGPAGAARCRRRRPRGRAPPRRARYRRVPRRARAHRRAL